MQLAGMKQAGIEVMNEKNINDDSASLLPESKCRAPEVACLSFINKGFSSIMKINKIPR